jgi:hypothetical protein
MDQQGRREKRLIEFFSWFFALHFIEWAGKKSQGWGHAIIAFPVILAEVYKSI